MNWGFRPGAIVELEFLSFLLLLLPACLHSHLHNDGTALCAHQLLGRAKRHLRFPIRGISPMALRRITFGDASVSWSACPIACCPRPPVLVWNVHQ
ncbi:hypothetical protein DENSPDRAFT_836284 [Dentipellis sp. KUC8613]|nr:hypothetical protein DENSPDRAFT_836284 [Dentipellis sp. KUC8613]